MTDTPGQPVIQTVITEHFIDIDALFRSKNPRMLKLLPRFLLSYLKRVIHQDEINAALYRHRDKFGLEFIAAILEEFGVNIQVPYLPEITAEGRYIVASNHPLGGLDGMALIHEVGKIRKDLVFPVNDLLMNLPNARNLFIPINKHGRNTENIAILDETFSSGKVILYFPAGLCSRKQQGRILDLDWKKTFITKARQYRRDIVPVFMEGRNSNFFYNLANLRKRSGIKANIEMLYLVDEMFKQEDKDLKIIFGPSIPYQLFDKRYNDVTWAGKLKEYVYTLAQGNREPFKPL